MQYCNSVCSSVQYRPRLSWVSFSMEYQAEHISLHSVAGASQLDAGQDGTEALEY